MAGAELADLVVVGAGTIGGWASVYAREDGAGRVIVLEAGLAGAGASSRAAGIVRSQGGIPSTVALGRWSVDFYNRQADRYGTDSGFRELGYILLAASDDEEREAHERIAMQRAGGLDVRWVSAAEAMRLNPTLSLDGFRGGSYCPTDGCIDPPRNVRAYSLAMARAGAELRERTAFTGLRTEAVPGDGRRVVGVETSAGPIATERVLLTGGPQLHEVGRLAGLRIPTGPVRHTVAVTERHAAFDVERLPMVYDVARGMYWRLEEGGLLFGWSAPDESPGPARTFDPAHLAWMTARLNALVPVTRGLGLRKAWAATIEYSPDHLPILGAGLDDRGHAIGGLTVASPCGHGMMWGPGIARVAADLALRGETAVADVSGLGLDRFDAAGRSRLATDRIALPLPTSTAQD